MVLWYSLAAINTDTYKWGETRIYGGSAAVYIDVNGRVCGALVHFGCYQHGHKLMYSLY